MQNDILSSLTRLSDAELVTRITGLVTRERDATAQLVAHLAEFDTRDVYLRDGYGSLHAYCCDALGLSDGEAYNRIEVARAARRFPLILDMLAAGTVTMTAVRLLAPRLTAANHREVLDSAHSRKKGEIEAIVARLSPRPDVQTSVRKLPTSMLDAVAPAGPTAPISLALDLATSDPPAASRCIVATAEAPPAPRAAVMPLSPDRYKLTLTIGGDTLEKLRLAKDMLGHAIPSGDDAAVLDRALTVLLTDLARKKFADTPKPRPTQGNETTRGNKTRTRHIPAAVQRVVWVRDLGRCAFIGATGHRCNQRRFVEFHHLDPAALGGEASVDTIELRCRRHNDYEGRLYFGKRRLDGVKACARRVSCAMRDAGARREACARRRPRTAGNPSSSRARSGTSSPASRPTRAGPEN